MPCGSSQQGSYKLILHSRNPLRVILLTNMNSLCSQLGLYNMPIKEMLLLILLLTNIPQLGDSRYLPSSAIFGWIWRGRQGDLFFFWKWNNRTSRKIICKTITLLGWIWRKRFPLISFSSITSLIHIPPITLFIKLTDVNQIESFECRTYSHLNHFVMFLRFIELIQKPNFSFWCFFSSIALIHSKE